MSAGKLAGKTIFITGASRGIGKAIALRAAQDGANIIVAAKTAEPHPKLPGTVFTAAKEIEEAGGRSLPCVVDIRDEDAVQSAVENAVAKFGGIDILINNASAISLTGTLETPMKKYDLMNGINARGTYLCSRVCLPHLKKGNNPHILNISPPLNLNPKWFKGHVAYTMAKYGMSLCVLGMAEEFKEEGIAVNALWPKTAIATAAMKMLAGNDYLSVCRKVEIMSDAAYSILTKDSRSFTGKFLIDEDVLKADGVTDFDQYNCVPGSNPMPDFFLDVETDTTTSTDQGPVGSSEIDAVFGDIKKLLNEELVQQTNGVYQFDLTGDENGTWFLDLKNAAGSAGKGAPESPNVTMTMDCRDFVQMFTGKLKPTNAFLAGKLRIKGDMILAMKLEKMMKKKSQL